MNIERDFYAEMREIAEDWLDDGSITKGEMIRQVDEMIEEIEEE